MKYVILYQGDNALCACRIKTREDIQAFVGMVWYTVREIEKAEFETLTEAFGALSVRSIRACYRVGIRRIINEPKKLGFNPYLPLGQG